MANRNTSTNDNSNSSIQDLLLRLMEDGLNQPTNTNPVPTSQTRHLNTGIWQSIAQNLLNRAVPNREPVPGPGPVQMQAQGPPPQNHFVQPQSTIQMNDLINHFMYDYTNSMRDYHDNMRRMIYLLEMMNSQAPSIPLPASQTGHLPAPTTPSVPLPTNNTTEELLFSYFFFPIQTATGQTQTVQQYHQEPREPLTRDQIAQYTRTYGYTNEMVSQDSSANVCPITLEAFQVGDVICEIIGCNHIFKRPSLINWFRRDGRCPVCRFELVNTVFTRGPVPSSSSVSVSSSSIDPLNPTETPVSPEETEAENTNTVDPLPETYARSTPSPVEVQMDEMLRGLFGMENIMQRVLDESGNEMYEFNIPINTPFPGSFFQNTYQGTRGETFDTSSNVPDVD